MSKKPSTLLAKAGCAPAVYEGALNMPPVRASTLTFPDYKTYKEIFDHPDKAHLSYGRLGNPTTRALENVLNKLHHAIGTRLYNSGLQAITATILALLEQGDELLLVDNAYWPTREFATQVLGKFGISYRFIPPDIGANITDYISDKTKLIFLESPGSLTFDIQDIEAITKISKERNILTAIDKTWATPLGFDGFKWGIDVQIESGTKYISGTSDLLFGYATTQCRHTFKKLKQYSGACGFMLDADSAYCALRGMRSLSVRLEKHERNAITVANFLNNHPKVSQVYHPALPTHPQHQRFKKYFTRSCGLFAFTLKNQLCDFRLEKFFAVLEHFRMGLSWGGYESLMLPFCKIDRAYDLPENPKQDAVTYMRIHIGLEDVDDLIEDLTKALAELPE